MAVVSPCFMMYGLLHRNLLIRVSKLTDETLFLVDNFVYSKNALRHIPKKLEGCQGLRQVITSTNYGLDAMRQR